MPCESFENPILDYLENQLPATDRARVETHLAGCAGCRAFAQQLQQLDAQLTRSVKPPRLSPMFHSKLQQRIQTTRVMSPAEIAERKRQIQAEYEAGLARLRPFALPSRRWFASLRYPAALVAVALLAWRFLPELPAVPAHSGFNIPGQDILPMLIVSMIFVAMGLMAAFPQRISRLREAVFAR